MRPERLDQRHVLPHPLAQLLSQLHTPDLPRRFVALLAFAEGVAHYLTAILIAEAAANGVEDHLLEDWISRNSFGAYLDAIDNLIRRRNGRPDRFLPELEDFARGRSRALLNELTQLRNAVAHHRLDPASQAATGLLDALTPRVDLLLEDLGFLSQYPIGAVKALRNLPDGTGEGQWVTYRGLTLVNPPVALTDARGMPSDLVLLLDASHGRALRLTPLFIVVEDAFCWLDIPRSRTENRGCYVRPGSTDAAPASAPAAIFDLRAGGRGPGLPLKQWISDRSQRPSSFAVHLDAESWKRLGASTRPTLMVPVHPAPASIAAAVAATMPLAAPPPVVHGRFEAPIAPTMMGVPAMVAIAPSHPPAPTVVSLPPPPVLSSPPRRPPSSPLRVGLIMGALLTGGVLLAWALSPGTPSRAATSAAPATNSRTALHENPALSAWVLRWAASATGAPMEDPASRAVYSPEPLDRFYAPSPGFHGMRSATVEGVVERWQERRAFNRFAVRPSASTWEPIPPERIAPRCRSAAGGDVIQVAVNVTEEGARVVAGNPRGRCTRVSGPYLLQVRPVADGWAICNETWSFDRALCASCPGEWPSCPRAMP